MGKIGLLGKIGLKAQHWDFTLKKTRSLLVEVGYSMGVGYFDVMEGGLSKVGWKVVIPDEDGGDS